MKAPCLDCVDRKLLCWNDCAKYKAWKEHEGKRKDAIANEKNKDRLLYEYDRTVAKKIKAVVGGKRRKNHWGSTE